MAINRIRFPSKVLMAIKSFDGSSMLSKTVSSNIDVTNSGKTNSTIDYDQQQQQTPAATSAAPPARFEDLG
eukprot:9190588-Lingulodinium_polyedra.AAC.1